MLVFFALGNAKVLSFALADAKKTISFAFWWNIGIKPIFHQSFFARVGADFAFGAFRIFFSPTKILGFKKKSAK